MIDTQIKNTEVEEKNLKSQFFAIVHITGKEPDLNAAEGVDFIFANTKKELKKLLEDDVIDEILGIFRGRQITFEESRKVTF